MKKITFSLLVNFLLFLPFLSSQTNWIWQNPYPIGNNINSICFVNDNICFLSDDAGVIYKSTNGGINWALISDKKLGYYIYFLSENTGIATIGNLYNRTTNGGINWYNVFIGPGDVNSLSFKDNNIGCATNNNYPYYVVKTTNGGVNFSSAQVSDYLFTSYLYGGFGIAAGSVVYRTNNGGNNWVYCPLSGSNLFFGSFVTSDNSGWIVGQNGSLLKTTDSGYNWIVKYSNVVNTLKDIRFINQNTGIIVGDSGTILRTSNGGDLWYPINSNTKLSLSKISVSNSNVFAVGESGKMFKSADFGVNWNQLSFGITYQINDIKFINSNTGIAVSDNGYIIKTTNKGNSWNVIYNLTTNNLNRVAFINENIIKVVGTDIVLSSTNSGANWTTQTTFPSNVNFTGISFVNELSGMIAGRSTINSYLFKTSNGGSTWNSIPDNNGWSYNYLSEIFSIDTDVSFLSAKNRVYKTTNGGLNWTMSTINSTYSITSLDFINNDKGVGCLSNGTIILTSNGGDNWLMVNGSTRVLKKIRFLNDNLLISVGYNGTFIKSSDGGINWNSYFTGTQNDLLSLCKLDPNNIYICGSKGTILHTTTGGSLVSITKNFIESPKSFYLYQNYPNPFNPTTNIRYDIPQNSFVKLLVFDILGNEIETLVNEKRNTGTYEEKFNGSQYPSGVYFYKLITDSFIEVKKMVLVK